MPATAISAPVAGKDEASCFGKCAGRDPLALMGDAIGVAAGPTAGYDRGRVDQAIMRLVALNLSFSLILLALAVVAILGPNPRNLIIVTAATTWVIYDRVVRGMTLSPRERDFVRAALPRRQWCTTALPPLVKPPIRCKRNRLQPAQSQATPAGGLL
jgi:hypothetical protein